MFRYPETLELPLFIENDVDVEENENENISDDEFDIYSDKRKLTTTIENELNTPLVISFIYLFFINYILI